MRCLYELLYKLIELLLSEFAFNNNNNRFLYSTKSGQTTLYGTKFITPHAYQTIIPEANILYFIPHKIF
jgi:hypothetical protein